MSNWTSSFVNASLASLGVNLVPNSMWLSFGLAGSLTSSVTLITIIRSNQLRSRYYSNCLHIACANLICAISMALVGSKRICLYIFETGEISSVQRCALDIGSVIFGSTAAVGQTFCLSFDRVLSLLCPFFYSQKFEQKGYCFNVAMWLLCIAFSIYYNTFGLTNSSQVAVCNHSLVYTDLENTIEHYLIVGLVSLTVLANLIILVYRRFIYRHNLNSSDSHHNENKSSRRLTKTMMFAVLSDVFLWLLTNQVIIVLAHSYSKTLEIKMAPYVPVASYMFAPVLNLVFYLAIDLRFRESFFAFIRLKVQTKKIVATSQILSVASKVQTVQSQPKMSYIK